MKRILSLTLSCAFILSVSLIPANAYDDGIMPLSPQCADCGGTTSTVEYSGHENCTPCPKNSNEMHAIAVNGRAYICDDCGTYNGADHYNSSGILFCTNSPMCFMPKTMW